MDAPLARATYTEKEFVYVIGLHAVQFGNNLIKKFRGQPKLDEAVGRVQFGCQRNFLNLIISIIGQACSPVTY